MKAAFKHPHNAPTAFILLTVTLLFVGVIFTKYPELKNTYLGSISKKFVDGSKKTDIEIPSAKISEFGLVNEVVIISDTTSSSTDSMQYPAGTDYGTTTENTELVADTLEPFKPSPESAWASLYFTTLAVTQESLKLDISKVKEWQQTGGLSRDLSKGSKGIDVGLMQYLLSRFDPEFSASLGTGTFGTKTKTALAKLQKRLGIAPTGIFSEETRFFFDSVYYKELCPDADPDQDKSHDNVSRRIAVPEDYIPGDLMRIPKSTRTIGVMCISREPSQRLGNMFNRASAEGHELAVFSAYRSANTQRKLVQYYLETKGKAGLDGVAEAGHSEHQLGTTVDISGKSIAYSGPNDNFGDTPEGKWLAENSYKFGFIMSYPQGKQAETGYIYEPWHFRYVGVDVAKDIFDEKMTIQEYFNLVQGI